MSQTSTEIKKNALMELFSKRQPQTVSQLKPVKKVKTNQNQEDDALYKLLSWRDKYEKFEYPHEGTYKIIKEKSIVKGDQLKWAQNVQGVFLNIDWDVTAIDQLVRQFLRQNELNLSQNLIHNGIVFVWGNKTNIGAMMDYFQKMNFFYVQNFIFVLLNRKKTPERSQRTITGNKSILNFFSVNKNSSQESDQKKHQQFVQKDYQIGKVQNISSIFCNENSTYFKETQKVLYMFRKIQKNQPLQLRHQRTSDVYFTIGDSLILDWKSKEIVYKMIETLLITANYKQKQPLKLIELWGDQSKPRKGWVTVVEEVQELTKCTISHQLSDNDLQEDE